MAIVCIGMMLTACEKDTKLPATTKKPTAQLKNEERIIAAFFQENRDHNTVHFQFDADQGGHFMIEESGTEIFIEGGGLTTADGAPVHGPIDMGVLETFDRSDMWQNNRTTMSRGGNGGIEGFVAFASADADDPADAEEGILLATGGAFDITMTSMETGDVVVAPDGVVTVKVDPGLTGGPNADAVLWDGQPGVQPDDNDWVPTGEAPGLDNGKYTWTWTGDPCNIDWSLNWNLPMTQLFADLPAVFNDQNAEIFIAFPGYPNMMASMDMYDASLDQWYEHGMFANQGQTLHFVAVGIYNGVLYAGIQTNTLGGPTHVENISMSPMTPQDIDQAIQALP
jgi:hypothetical protein